VLLDFSACECSHCICWYLIFLVSLQSCKPPVWRYLFFFLVPYLKSLSLAACVQGKQEPNRHSPLCKHQHTSWDWSESFWICFKRFIFLAEVILGLCWYLISWGLQSGHTSFFSLCLRFLFSMRQQVSPQHVYNVCFCVSQNRAGGMTWSLWAMCLCTSWGAG
jgi:hypothetical protein